MRCLIEKENVRNTPPSNHVIITHTMTFFAHHDQICSRIFEVTCEISNLVFDTSFQSNGKIIGQPFKILRRVVGVPLRAYIQD